MKKVIFITGVSCTGKTSVGKGLTKKMGLLFFDGNDFHSSSNIKKMASCISLTHKDRLPWLRKIKPDIKIAHDNLHLAYTIGRILRIDIKKYLNDIISIPFIQDYILENIKNFCSLTSRLALSNHSYITLTSSLDYFKYLITRRSPSNLRQDQRDYFGAHTYQLDEDPTGKHYYTKWNQL